ncbi:DUF5655 domain-containing protein [Phenylobacterium aquaticum]|uniref:DUF5655 domain-containing protein n=1 Tax=Phenylobacterium aquaticum TaxID=1763816 RepID=UPI0026E95F84|nr:DUF5655 domain-containing protein [Phenylobacterium aquaticum]
MASLDQAVSTFERNLAAQTGKAVAEWVNLVQAKGFEKHGQIMAWLKADHGLSHGHANHVAKRALEAAAPRSTDDPAAHLFEGDKAALRPLYDAVVAFAAGLGGDVEVAPKKANVSLRRRRQFALVQPSTRTRLDLGLNLKNRAPVGRLELSGSFNAMFSHRVRLETRGDFDAEVQAWLAEAYGEAE